VALAVSRFEIGFPDVIRHTALWSSDFPPAFLDETRAAVRSSCLQSDYMRRRLNARVERGLGWRGRRTAPISCDGDTGGLARAIELAARFYVRPQIYSGNVSEELIVPTHADVIVAVQAGDVGKIRGLLATDPSLAAARDAKGVSALMFAFYHRRPEIADLLLAAKPDLDIFEATAAGKADKVSQILKKDPDAAKRWSADGFTALHLAAFFGRPEIARILIRNAADVSATSRNSMKVAPLHSAAAAHSREIVRLLLENDAPADVRQEGGWTPLHEAAQIGDVEMARDLLQHRADPQARSDDGKTPEDMAAAKGHEEIVKLLSK
jgi:uncharacterized protein